MLTSTRVISEISKIYIIIPVQTKIFKQSVRVACEAMTKCETKLNELDAEAGDGDCGTTMLSGANGNLMVYNINSITQ